MSEAAIPASDAVKEPRSVPISTVVSWMGAALSVAALVVMYRLDRQDVSEGWAIAEHTAMGLVAFSVIAFLISLLLSRVVQGLARLIELQERGEPREL